MSTTVKHPDRLAKQVNHILANPDSWDQGKWHSACGTKHCIAGHGQIASGRPMDNPTCTDDAREWYGLTCDDADWLFDRDRTLPELHGFASSALAGEPYFDSGGYNRDGFNRHGFDRGGFKRTSSTATASTATATTAAASTATDTTEAASTAEA